MKKILRRLFKFLAYLAAGVVILLAVAVGIFRLMLPRLPAYQEELKLWASAAIGLQVEFTGMDARWGLSGPELKFYNAELIRDSNMTRLLAAEEIGLGVGLVRLLVDRTLVVDRVTVRDTSLVIRRLENGSWRIQGNPADEILALNSGAAPQGPVHVIIEDVELQFLKPGDERPTYFDVPRLQLQRDDVRIAIDAFVRLPDDLGRQASVSATRFLGAEDDSGSWDVTMDIEDLDLAGLSNLQGESPYAFQSGRGDLNLSLSIGGERIESATADMDFADISIAPGQVFDTSGRIEYHGDADGWLVVAEELRINSPWGDWPEASLHVETSTDRDGAIVMLDFRASYLNLTDAELLLPWLSETQQDTWWRLRPDGVVRNLSATVSDIDTESPRFSVSAVMESAGLAASGNIPGIRGFSGQVRADSSGGLVEIDAQNMLLSLPEFLSDPVAIDSALGTVIWRRSDNRTTILSDSIAITNAEFDSVSNIELSIGADGIPVIDLASTWSIADIAAAKRYIPQKVLTPKLYDWFQVALVSGRISHGSTRLYGPLNKFPFDSGEGRLLIEANIRDTEFRYLPQWPAANLIDLDVVLDNTRLHSTRNRSLNIGNSVVDANIEIQDVRDPVLTIDAYSTGTLSTIHDFASNSPIGNVFGGQLARVSADGDASFSLDLVVPIKDWRSFTFTTRVLSNGGSLTFDGFGAPVTELTGAVTIERDTISSEALGGQFMGNPVAIELRAAPADRPEFQIMAQARGIVTADGLINEVGVPLDNIIEGQADFDLDILFPRRNPDAPVPVTFEIESDLVGLGVALPVPFTKTAQQPLNFNTAIRFPTGGQRIESAGEAEGGVAWQIAFESTEAGWDFDRGVLALGNAPLTDSETRGLHVRGQLESLRLRDWLDLSRESGNTIGAADRLRSAELTIDNLRLFGQHLEGHTVRLDRSALDWLVQFEGDKVSGSVFVPYDLNADRALVFDMERLILPGDAEDTAPSTLEPTSVPSISLRVAEFGLGDRYLGSVEAEFERTEEGLFAQRIVATDPSFEIVGTGRWVTDSSDPAGHRTSITATLTSTNVLATTNRLNYAPGLESDDMSLLMNVSWSGGPREEFMDTLDGEVDVRFGKGQLIEVEPGAGRMMGLMSIVALPRRLSLDFSDVFDKGFGFDLIEGKFRIDDGEAFTCNLSLEGPAADIGIVGSADLAIREYQQTAVVSANFGNTLPIVGAVVAGPQVAAALLIISQIFKKPLQDVSQVYYDVDGSWDDPVVEIASAEQFAARGKMAGCLTE